MSWKIHFHRATAATSLTYIYRTHKQSISEHSFTRTYKSRLGWFSILPNRRRKNCDSLCVVQKNHRFYVVSFSHSYKHKERAFHSEKCVERRKSMKNIRTRTFLFTSEEEKSLCCCGGKVWLFPNTQTADFSELIDIMWEWDHHVDVGYDSLGSWAITPKIIWHRHRNQRKRKMFTTFFNVKLDTFLIRFRRAEACSTTKTHFRWRANFVSIDKKFPSFYHLYHGI